MRPWDARDLLFVAAVLKSISGVCRAEVVYKNIGEKATGSPPLEQQYEWVTGEQVYQYAQDSSFSLLKFHLPLRIKKAELKIKLLDAYNQSRSVILSLRHAGIPVVNAFNETAPASFLLRTDQLSRRIPSNGSHVISIPAPRPGPLYLLASVLNPLQQVIQHLRWGQDFTYGDCVMDVTAVYSLQVSVTSLPISTLSRVTIQKSQAPSIYSFYIPGFTTRFDIIINNCHHGNSTTCPMNVTTSFSLGDVEASSVRVSCHGDSGCNVTVKSPLVDHQHYVSFQLHEATVDDVTFDVKIDVQGCHAESSSYTRQALVNNSLLMYLPQNPYTYFRKTRTQPGNSDQCFNLGLLGRVGITTDSGFAFAAMFGRWNNQGDVIPVTHVAVPDFRSEVRSFALQDSVDTGGILHIRVSSQERGWNGTIQVCAMPQRLAESGELADCKGALLSLQLGSNSSGTEEVSDRVFFPFPVAGPWYLTMQSQCLGRSGPEPCRFLPLMGIKVEMTQCAPDKCGQFGQCKLYMEATTVYAGCYCLEGYRGLSCDDEEYAIPVSQQLRAVYLLTLSNLAFLPSIALALYRSFYTMAAIFAFNCFFSAFYHACDTSQVYQLCIVDYETLAFCDFLGSVLSFYCVLLHMARLPQAVRAFLLIMGTLIIAVFQNQDRHSNTGHVVPLVIAGVFLTGSWGWEMRARGHLFPSWRRYVYFLLPGVAVAATGIGVNYGLMRQKDTYQYSHSFWHVSLMLVPCLLMPPRRRKGVGKSQSISSAQDILKRSSSQTQQQHIQQQQQQQQQEDVDDLPVMLNAGTSNNSEENLIL